MLPHICITDQKVFSTRMYTSAILCYYSMRFPAFWTIELLEQLA